jgi:hypothetical protein
VRIEYLVTSPKPVAGTLHGLQAGIGGWERECAAGGAGRGESKVSQGEAQGEQIFLQQRRSYGASPLRIIGGGTPLVWNPVTRPN